MKSLNSQQFIILCKKIIFVCMIIQNSYVLAGSITATINPKEGSVGTSFQLQLEIHGNLEQNVDFPEVEGISVQGTGRSSSISIINGRSTSSLSLGYTISVSKPGNFTIPSIQAKIDGQIEKTTPISFIAKKPSDHISIEGSTLPAAFLQTEFSKRSPYLGEGIIKKTKLFFRIKVVDESRAINKSPDLKYHEIDKEVSKENFGGTTFSVLEYSDLIIPRKAGPINVPGDTVNIEVMQQSRRHNQNFFGGFFDDAFSQRSVFSLAANDDNLDIKPLPQKGRPKNFQGTVGTFKIKTSLNPKKLKQSETATLTIKIEGLGLLENIPNIPLDLGSDIKIYPDKPNIEEKISKNGIASKRSMKYAIVPNKSGSINLGTISLPVFNPKTETYSVLTANLGTMEVEAFEEARKVTDGSSAGLISDKYKVESLGHDLIDIHRNFEPKTSTLLHPGNTLWYVLTIVFFPLVLLICLIVKTVNNRTYLSSPRYKRDKAYKIFDKEINQWKKSYNKENFNLDSVKSYYDIYRNYLGHKFMTNGQSLTYKEIKNHLARYNLNPKIVDNVKKLSTNMDELEFSPKSFIPSNNLQVFEVVDELVKEIEKNVK